MASVFKLSDSNIPTDEMFDFDAWVIMLSVGQIYKQVGDQSDVGKKENMI